VIIDLLIIKFSVMLPVKSHLLPTVSRFFDDDWNSLFNWNARNFSNESSTLPAVNIRETKDDYIVEMAAPGMSKDDFEIELKNNALMIKSELSSKHEDDEDQYARREFSYSSFVRSFNLNSRVVDDAKIEASYNNGVLKLVLPKKEEAKEKAPRLIKIS